MSFFMVFFLFGAFTVANLLVSFFAPRFIPYLGFFPYKEILTGYHLPDFISKFANFDGTHYLLIAQQGYMQYEQAYFPLYPLLIKLLTIIFLKNTLFIGLIISNISFLLGSFILVKLLRNYGLRITDLIWVVIFLLVFPTSFFFGTIYTESLFFLLFVASLYFLQKKHYFLAGLFAILSSLTRLMGIFLIIPIILSFRTRSGIQKLDSRFRWNDKKNLIFIAPFLGLFSYMIYLWKTVGDPLFFLNSQPIFGAHRSTSLIFLPQVYWRYAKILLTANHDFRYFVSFLEFSTFSFIFVILILDLIKNLTPPKAGKNYGLLSLNLFSLANILLPTLTGTFSSVPRYTLLSLSAFVYLGQLKQTWIKILLVIVFLILHVITLGFFTQGYFIG